MSNTVDRLKQLLFDDESRTLAGLSARIDALAQELGVSQEALKSALTELRVAHTQSAQQLSSRLDSVFERAGDLERLEKSVAAVMDGALRRAEEERHHLVSEAVAPFVVGTVKTEIRNSRDELVEALYPVTGRIVKAYVASAIKDLADQINQRLEMNPVMLRLRSWATGRPVSELVIADTQRLKVEDIFLIRRGTGELVARWPERPAGSNHDQVLSGVLTAINEFASEALHHDGSALRHIDLGSDTVYLRTSPTFLLAARCTGTAPRAVERVVDEVFLRTIEDLGASPALAADARQPNHRLANLSSDLIRRIDDTQEEISGRRLGASPIKILASIIVIPILAWLAWSFYADYRASAVRATVSDILNSTEELKGYPTRVAVGWLGREVTIVGLAPTELAQAQVLKEVAAALPKVAIHDEISVVPNALSAIEPKIERLRQEAAQLPTEIARTRASVDDLKSDYESEIVRLRAEAQAMQALYERDAMIRDIDRTMRYLRRATTSLDVLDPDASGTTGDVLRTTHGAIDSVLSDLAAIRRKLGQDAGEVRDAELAVPAVAERLAALTRQVSAIPDAGTLEPVADAAAYGLNSLMASAEHLDAALQRAAQAQAIRRSLVPPSPATPSPRERLIVWSKTHAVFFADDLTFRDAETVSRLLDELARLMREDESLVVRVIGYTDQIGSLDRNSPLAEQRARVVADELERRGVDPRQLVTLGRTNAVSISALSGPDSPNRRVEFEVGFVGETAR
jgi:outer membrane protein OmpA-like peptidoglycan-associated protein